MGIRYEIVNLEDIPSDLPPGKYRTRVTERTRWDGSDFVIAVEYVGPWDDDDPCLIPLTKHSLDAYSYCCTVPECGGHMFPGYECTR